MAYHLTVLVDGALTGALYAPIALAFVVVYRASGMINFALGEWSMLAAALVTTGLWTLGLGLTASLIAACLGMIAFGLAFNRVVLRPLLGRSVVALIMVTLGLGALMRGAAAIAFTSVPRRIPMPIQPEPIVAHGVLVPTDKLLAAAVASVAVALVTWFFRSSRSGLALRAIADDQQVAMAMGIDVQRHFAIAWSLVGVMSVVAGTLWTLLAGSGFGVVLVGLRVFPIVILGGLDSTAGTIVAAFLVGVLEAAAASYLDGYLGGGFSTIASYLVLLVVLLARPYGLLGRPAVARV